jgi:hypothetical protein
MANWHFFIFDIIIIQLVKNKNIVHLLFHLHPQVAAFWVQFISSEPSKPGPKILI